MADSGDSIVGRETGPLLSLFDGPEPWEVVGRSDGYVSALADRHYPRRARGCGHVGGPGRVVVLRGGAGLAGWISLHTAYPDDGLDGWRCTMFRNEVPDLRSSELIVAAMAITERLWGPPPADGWITYVDTAKVTSRNPGYCFKAAGWRRDRSYQPGRRRASLIRLLAPPVAELRPPKNGADRSAA